MNGVNLDAVDYGRISPIDDVELTLDSARSQTTPLEINRAGDFLYVSDASDGEIYIRFNSEDAPRIRVRAGFSVSGALFRRLYVDWSAQSGLSVQVIHGFGARFAPTNDIANIGAVSSVSAVGAITAPLTPRTFVTSYYVYSSSGAVITIVSPASNVAGIRIDRATLAVNATDSVRFMSKSSAPSAWNDSNARGLLGGQLSANTPISMHDSKIIPAGEGLYLFSLATAIKSFDLSYEILS